MSGLKSDVKFEYQGQLSVYRASYSDANKNKWRIEVVGTAESAQNFIKERPFNLTATRLTLEEAKKRKEETKKRKEELAGKKPAQETRRGYESPMSIERSVREVIFSIEKLADPSSPYAVHFEIDPPMNSDHKPEEYSFQLVGAEKSANVSYKANAGTVGVILSGFAGYSQDGPNVNGQVVVDDVPALSDWRVHVLWGSGAPDYTLSGDIVVL